MARPEKFPEMARRLRSLADAMTFDGDEVSRGSAMELLHEAATVIDQSANRMQSTGDSYVLMLIDAHSHPFCSEIFRKPSTPTYPALDPSRPFNIRNHLHQAIRQYLIETASDATLRTSRLVVRVYADSPKLENDLLCPLQQFSIQFSSIDPYFDFIGVRDELMVEVKVTDAFQTAVKDPNCKHIFFAAWRRPVYPAMLRTCPKNVTLVEGNGMGAGYKLVMLPCRSVSIPEVFSKPTGQDMFASLTSHSTGKQLAETLISDKAVFKDGLRALSHVATSFDEAVEATKSNGNPNARHQSTQLPQLRDAIPGHIPVNANRQRLDYYTRQPSPADRKAYFERYDGALLPCKWYYLANLCHFQGGCSFDHSEISAQVHKVIKYMFRRKPCKMGSECRLIDCIYGHVCQDTRCITDGFESCSMKKFHGVDQEFARWVKGKHAPEFPTGATKDAQTDDGENATVKSLWF